MHLSQNNFFEGRQTFKTKEGSTITGQVYTYESKLGLFDVLLLNGRKLYQKNMRGYNLTPTKIHKEIEKHYSI